MTTVGEYLVKRLEEVGIKHVFGVPGDYVLDFMDRIIDSDMDFVGTCNELNAGYAGDAYARLNGVSAVVITYDVGGLSLVNAVAGAYAERVPMIIISGSPHSKLRHENALIHHIATDYKLQMDVFGALTACSVMLEDGADARLYGLDGNLVRAAWNLVLLRRDGSHGVHNPRFTMQVLRRSATLDLSR